MDKLVSWLLAADEAFEGGNVEVQVDVPSGNRAHQELITEALEYLPSKTRDLAGCMEMRMREDGRLRR